MILDKITKSNSILINQLVSQYYPLSLELIERFTIDKLDYQLVLMNENIDWDEQKIFYFFESHNDLDYVYYNSSIYFTSKIIERLEDNIDWIALSRKEEVDWSIDLLCKYEDFWNWYCISSNKSIKWSKQIIDRFFYKLDFNELSKNESLTWLEEFVKEKIKSLTDNVTDFCHEIGLHIENWEWTPSNDLFGPIKETEKDWYALSMDSNLPWSIEYISKRKRYWKWYYLSGNTSLPWSIELIDKFKDNLDWSNLSYNPSLPWSESLIDTYKDKWRWIGLCSNFGVNWDIPLIRKYQSSINWNVLSKNENLPWSIELIETYKNNWDWDAISGNSGFLWNKVVFENYSHLINWNRLCEEAKRQLSHSYIINLNLFEIETILEFQSPLELKDYYRYDKGDEIIERASDMYGFTLDKFNEDADWDQQGPDFDF